MAVVTNPSHLQGCPARVSWTPYSTPCRCLDIRSARPHVCHDDVCNPGNCQVAHAELFYIPTEG